MDNNHNNAIPPNGIPPGWIFYPYPPLVIYPPLQTAQTSQALTPIPPPALTHSAPPPPDPEPKPEPEPEEVLPFALPAQIKFVACHHCGVCGRSRSHAYHKEHPLIPGQVAPAGTCRKCIKKHDRGEPIDSMMLSLSMRSHATEKESSGQFYDPPSSEPSRGRLRSVSWRHVAPRGISRPRIESLDGYTNDPSEPAPPPPAPSVPRSSRSEKAPSDKPLSDKAPSDRLSRTQSARVSRSLSDRASRPPSGKPPSDKMNGAKSARMSRPPSDKVSRATSSAGSSQRTAHSGYASQTLPRRELTREIRETIEVRTRRPLSPAPEARETRSIIKASSKPLYRTPTSDPQGEPRHTHDQYHVRFERSPSCQLERRALVRRDEQELAPYYRHVERRTEETAPEEVAESTYHTYKRREEFEEEEVDTRLQFLRSGSKSGLQRQKSTSFNRFILGLFPACPPGYYQD